MLLVALCFASTVRADGNPATDNVAPLFSYGGMLERDGLAVNADVTMTFKLYDAAASNTVVWRETQVVPVSAGRFSVLLGECEGLGATARCPMGDDNSAVHISDIVRRADDIYLAIDLDAGSGPVSLQNRKRWVPVPYARLATHAADFEVANKLTVKGTLAAQGAIEAQAILPKYQAWASQGLGDGGAAIYNDDQTYKALLISGSDLGGNGRKVNIYDDANVSRDMAVGGNLTVTGDSVVQGALDIGYQTINCAGGNCFCPVGKRMLSWTANCANSGMAIYSAALVANGSTGQNGINVKCWHTYSNQVFDTVSQSVICARVR